MEHIYPIQTTESWLMENDDTDDSKHLKETQCSVNQSASLNFKGKVFWAAGMLKRMEKDR